MSNPQPYGWDFEWNVVHSDVSTGNKKDAMRRRSTRKRLIATGSRREGVYNRAGKPSVPFCGKRGARERADDFFFAAGKKEAGAKRTLLQRDIVGRFRFVLDAGGNPPQNKRPGARLAPGPCLVVREMGVEPT